MIHAYIGKSAAGKDTMVRKILSQYSKIKPIVLWSTRPMREGEVQDVTYHFVSDEEFEAHKAAGGFVESRKYDTLYNNVPAVWKYGTPIVDPDGEYVIPIEIEGVTKLIEYYGAENVDVIYIMASDETRKERAIKRKTFSEVEWERRLISETETFSEENIRKLEELYGKPITIIDNN